jgi:hypothetical protein
MMAKLNIYRTMACAILMFAGADLPGAGIASASDFTVQGSYAVHGIIGSYVGSSIGVYTVDTNGGLSGHALLNLPSADGQSRTVTRVNITGTVTVNPDGTGQANYTAPLPNGSTATITEDFVITKARQQGSARLATAIFDQRQQASVFLGNGYEVVIFWTRLPDDGTQ